MAGNVWLPECCAKPEGGQELDHLVSAEAPIVSERQTAQE